MGVGARWSGPAPAAGPASPAARAASPAGVVPAEGPVRPSLAVTCVTLPPGVRFPPVRGGGRTEGPRRSPAARRGEARPGEATVADELEELLVPDAAAWRAWLAEHH